MTQAHISFSSLARTETFKGALWMVGWAFSINSSVVLAKFLSPDIHTTMLIFMRTLFGLIIFLPFFWHQRNSLLQAQQPWRHIANVGLITAAMGCTYYSYRHLPLGFATSIGFSGPLITTILSIILLKDKPTLLKISLIISGYLGVLIALYPINTVYHPAIFGVLLANLLASLAIINRKFLLATDTPTSIFFYSSIGSFLLSGLAASFFFHSLELRDILLLCGMGGFGATSQYCYISALKKGNPSFIAPFEYSRLLFAIPVGCLVFAETFRLGMVIGTTLIVICAYALTRLQLYQEQSLQGRKG